MRGRPSGPGCPWEAPLYPQYRPRSLTLPLPPPISDTLLLGAIPVSRVDLVQLTSSQRRSSFLTRLPFEVRLQIYEKALAGQILHLTLCHADERLRAFKCIKPKRVSEQKWLVKHTCDRCILAQHGRCQHGLLALPLTCRMIYTEALPVLYERNTLAFTQRACFSRFIKRLPTHHHSWLRRIHYRGQIRRIFDHKPWCCRQLSASNRSRGQGFQDWDSLCVFMAEILQPRTILYLDLSVEVCEFCRLDQNEYMKSREWLMSLWMLSEHVDLRLAIPYLPSKDSSIRTVIDMNELKLYNGLLGVKFVERDSSSDTLLGRFGEALRVRVWGPQPAAM